MDDLVLGMAPFGNASVHESSAHDDTCLIGAGCQGLGLVSHHNNHQHSSSFSAIPYPAFNGFAGHGVASSPSPKVPGAGDPFPEADTGKWQSTLKSPGYDEPDQTAPDQTAPDILSLKSLNEVSCQPPQDDTLFEEYAPSEAESNASCDSQCSGSKGPCSAGTCDFVTACRDENCTRPVVEPDVAHSAFILQAMTSAKEAGAAESTEEQTTIYQQNMAEHGYSFGFDQGVAYDCGDPMSHSNFAYFMNHGRIHGFGHLSDPPNHQTGNGFFHFLGKRPHCHASAPLVSSDENGMVNHQDHSHGGLLGECGVPFSDPLQALLHMQKHVAQEFQFGHDLQLQHPQQQVPQFAVLGTFPQQLVPVDNHGGQFRDPNQYLPSPPSQGHLTHSHPSPSFGRPAFQQPSPVIDRIASPAVSSPSAEDPAREPTEFVCLWSHGMSACMKVFDDASQLEKHVQADHVENMPREKGGFVCGWSGCARERKPFGQKSKVKRHMLTHTQYKPFKCEHCEQTFSAKQALSQHVLIHEDSKPLKCDECSKTFRQQSALTMHKRTHTGLKPLKCSLCDATFSESSNLSKHRRTHDAMPRFKCPEAFCEKRFHRLDQCRRHLDTIHKRTPEEVKLLCAPMVRRRGSSAPRSRSSTGSVAGSINGSMVPGRQLFQPVPSPEMRFLPQMGPTDQFANPVSPAHMAEAVDPSSHLQYGQVPPQSGPQLYSSHAVPFGRPTGAGFSGMSASIQHQPFQVSSPFPNGIEYSFDQPVQSYPQAGSNW